MALLPGPSNQLALAAAKVFNTLRPSQEPKALWMTLPFSVTNPIPIDIQGLLDGGEFDFAQAVFVDNSLNAQQLLLVSSITQQPLRIPKNACAYLPILAGNQSKYVASCTGGADAYLALLNFVVAPIVWVP